jgi:hypothetical protein
LDSHVGTMLLSIGRGVKSEFPFSVVTVRRSNLKFLIFLWNICILYMCLYNLCMLKLVFFSQNLSNN